jgi:hypothetical protein
VGTPWRARPLVRWFSIIETRNIADPARSRVLKQSRPGEAPALLALWDLVPPTEVHMSVCRSAALALLVPIVGACATLPAPQAPGVASDITLVLTAPPQRVREQLLAAFPANGLPVAISQPAVIEYHGARERGVLGYYEVFARAIIEPVDCTTRVTLFGEETRYTNPTAIRGTSVRIGPSSSGRAAEVWQKLQRVAEALGKDGTVRAHC